MKMRMTALIVEGLECAEVHCVGVVEQLQFKFSTSQHALPRTHLTYTPQFLQLQVRAPF